MAEIRHHCAQGSGLVAQVCILWNSGFLFQRSKCRLLSHPKRTTRTPVHRTCDQGPTLAHCRRLWKPRPRLDHSCSETHHFHRSKVSSLLLEHWHLSCWEVHPSFAASKSRPTWKSSASRWSQSTIWGATDLRPASSHTYFQTCRGSETIKRCSWLLKSSQISIHSVMPFLKLRW